MKGIAIILALLALPVGARAEGTNPVWMFAQQYVAESEARTSVLVAMTRLSEITRICLPQPRIRWQPASFSR
jgi:hypothetical protein